MLFRIAVLGGDGIGPSVIEQALKVLWVIERHTSHRFEVRQGLIGGAALWETGRGLPQETLDLCLSSDAVLLGAVGDERWDRQAGDAERSTASVMRLRRALDCYANIRPVRCEPRLFELSYLKERALADGVDLVFVREMSAGLFYGTPRGFRTVDGVEEAFNTLTFTRPQVERVARIAFDLARRRRRRVTSVDQANVLESHRLWRDVVSSVARDYPDVTLEHLYVDNCANELSRRPYGFDVILVEGIFGGILSDQVAAVSGSIGMLPSASIGDHHGGIYEPVHGSAPKYAGQDRVNPIGAIRSLALLLDLALNLKAEAERIEEAVVRVICRGIRTYDIATPGCTLVGTAAMGDAIATELEAMLKADSG